MSLVGDYVAKWLQFLMRCINSIEQLEGNKRMPRDRSDIEAKAVTTAGAVADYLLWAARERGDALTNLKLQKLLYYAQGWYLALHGRPLFDEDFQAWVHGPVLPSQYHRFKAAAWMPISEAVTKPKLPDGVESFLDEILDVFGTESAIALEQMTHREQPWIEARRGVAPDESSSATISKRTMRDFYRSLRDS